MINDLVGMDVASSMVASLRCALQVALQQNAELRSRLQKIRNDAELAISTDGPNLTMALELDLNPSQRQVSLSFSLSRTQSHHPSKEKSQYVLGSFKNRIEILLQL